MIRNLVRFLFLRMKVIDPIFLFYLSLLDKLYRENDSKSPEVLFCCPRILVQNFRFIYLSCIDDYATDPREGGTHDKYDYVVSRCAAEQIRRKQPKREREREINHVESRAEEKGSATKNL